MTSSSAGGEKRMVLIHVTHPFNECEVSNHFTRGRGYGGGRLALLFVLHIWFYNSWKLNLFFQSVGKGRAGPTGRIYVYTDVRDSVRTDRHENE